MFQIERIGTKPLASGLVFQVEHVGAELSPGSSRSRSDDFDNHICGLGIVSLLTILSCQRHDNELT